MSDWYFPDTKAHPCTSRGNSSSGGGRVDSLLQTIWYWQQKANSSSHGTVLSEQEELDYGGTSNSRRDPRSIPSIPRFPNCSKFLFLIAWVFFSGFCFCFVLFFVIHFCLAHRRWEGETKGSKWRPFVRHPSHMLKFTCKTLLWCITWQMLQQWQPHLGYLHVEVMW